MYVKIRSCYLMMVVVLLLSLCRFAWAASEYADPDPVILANGNILTMNAGQPTASAMAVKKGKIVAVGDLATVKKVVGKSYEYIDLEGDTVVPGFIESHDHLVLYGSVLQLLDISPFVTPSLKDALQKLKTEAQPDKKG